MNITEAVKKRFEELCYKKDINYCKLASLSGVPYTTVKSIFYNQSKNPAASAEYGQESVLTDGIFCVILTLP